MRVFGCLNKLYNILNSTSLEFVMLKRELLNILEDAARDCRVELIDCIIRNKHMNKLTPADIRKLRSDRGFQQKVVEAVVVQFINKVAIDQGIDLGLYVKHLRKNNQPHG